jgi:hypothetical protein
MALIVPNGLTQVKATFGDYPFHELSGGNVAVEGDWVEKNVVMLKNVAGTGLNIQIHKLLAVDFEAALKEAMAAAPQYKIRMLGGFCPRHQMHLPKNPLSIHSWAAAFDLNWDKNLVVSASATLAEKAAGCDMPKELVDVFRKHGWEWGGDWKSVKDYMHFQYATGC